jgi:hypothetical protein
LSTRDELPNRKRSREHDLADALADLFDATGGSVTEAELAEAQERLATTDARRWKADAIRAGLLLSRPADEATDTSTAISTPAGYASGLLSSERDER